MQDARTRKETAAAGAEPLTPIEALSKIVSDIEELMRESVGVHGMFGARSQIPWGEFVAGGMSGWLGDSLRLARDAIANHSERGDEHLRCSPDYEILASILQMALDQAQTGKGRERHANDRTFVRQPILSIARMLEGIDGHAFQVMKKTQEAARMFHRKNEDAATRELLGVIVYAAAAVIFIQEESGRRSAAI